MNGVFVDSLTFRHDSLLCRKDNPGGLRPIWDLTVSKGIVLRYGEFMKCQCARSADKRGHPGGRPGRVSMWWFALS